MKLYKYRTIENLIRDFVQKFKNDVAERNCNIFLMDADTDLSILTDCFNMDEDYVANTLLQKCILAVMKWT